MTLSYGGKTQTQEVVSQSSFYSNNDSRLHFDLGDATKPDISVRWPSSLTQRFAAVPDGTLLVIDETAGLNIRPLKA